MKKFAKCLSAAVLTAALVAGAAGDADAGARKKKLNFLEALFSSHRTDRAYRKPRQNLFGRDWWSRRDQGDVRIIYGTDDLAQGNGRIKRIPDANNQDPEGDFEQIGMGNLTYVAAKVVPLGAAKLTEPRPFGLSEAEIYDALVSKDLGIRVNPQIRQVILDHYRGQGFRPLWLENDKLAARALALLKVLAAAPEDGMQATLYIPPGLPDFESAVTYSSNDLLTLARLDLSITAMAMKYARDASGGHYDPRRLSLYHDITPEYVDAATSLRVLAWSPFPDAYLVGLQPKHPAYAAMKSALAKLRKDAGEQVFVPIATGKRVKPGQSDDRLESVRQRLVELGTSVPPAADTMLLDKGLAAALKQFQKSAKIKVTGTLENSTVNALNHHGDRRNLRRLVYNMERLRWLPKNLGRRNVFVNQAAFQVTVMDGTSQIWRSNVIVGKPMTQTAVFNDQIETVVFNPSWGVPPSIIANEYLPKLRDDPYYLDRIGFKVSTAEGQTIPSADIDWWAYGNTIPYSIQQPPGKKNALGELKFLFPNSHNIYMHDTPNRELFAEDTRAFSHGCVRVQNPREFATILLGWDKAKVDANASSKKSQTVRLPVKVPIHISYFTVWPDESGNILYYNDIYGRDETLEKAMSATTLAQR